MVSGGCFERGKGLDSPNRNLLLDLCLQVSRLVLLNSPPFFAWKKPIDLTCIDNACACLFSLSEFKPMKQGKIGHGLEQHHL